MEQENDKVRTFVFHWREYHSHSVEAKSLQEAKKKFEYEIEEGCGGQSTYEDSSEPYILVEDL